MSVYVVGQIKIKDQAVWQEYKDQVGDTLKPYGGRVLFRAQATDSFVGACAYPEIVAIEFDSIDQAKAWYGGEEYQRIAPLRKQSADVILCIYR